MDFSNLYSTAPEDNIKYLNPSCGDVDFSGIHSANGAKSEYKNSG